MQRDQITSQDLLRSGSSIASLLIAAGGTVFGLGTARSTIVFLRFTGCAAYGSIIFGRTTGSTCYRFLLNR